MNTDINQGFDRDNLMSYEEANKHGVSFYIAAEIDPKVSYELLLIKGFQ